MGFGPICHLREARRHLLAGTLFQSVSHTDLASPSWGRGRVREDGIGSDGFRR